jgi:hypothetical protein
MDQREYLITSNKWEESTTEKIWWEPHKTVINFFLWIKGYLFKNLYTPSYHTTTSKTKGMNTSHHYHAAPVNKR